MALTFIGYRGSGKSSVGAIVAARLGSRFVDADDEVERRSGRTIREIFATGGEASFRALEREVMAELLADDRLVIAAGGGAVTSLETRARMRQSGPVIYLRVTAETAEQRIAGDASTIERRPPLTEHSRRAEAESVIAAREPLYLECATIVIDANRRTVADLVDDVLAVLPAEYRREAAK